MSHIEMADWEREAKEPYFKLLDESSRRTDRINTMRVRCGPSGIVPEENGVFAREDIAKGEIIEWGLATRIPGLNVQNTDIFYAWDVQDRSVGATLTGCGLFYNTNGDESNARCVPYHSENRFEIYALENIAAGDEITIRYDSMNYREAMQHLVPLVGPLRNGIV